MTTRIGPDRCAAGTKAERRHGGAAARRSGGTAERRHGGAAARGSGGTGERRKAA